MIQKGGNSMELIREATIGCNGSDQCWCNNECWCNNVACQGQDD